MRELALYSPTRSRRAVLVELEERSEGAVLGVLAAVETCLSANEIPSVHVELDGRSYLLAMSESFDPLKARRLVQRSPADAGLRADELAVPPRDAGPLPDTGSG